jgi:hypothetical protein
MARLESRNRRPLRVAGAGSTHAICFLAVGTLLPRCYVEDERKIASARGLLIVSEEARLTLRELEAAAGFGFAVFLALDDAAVAGEETLALQQRAQARLVAG